VARIPNYKIEEKLKNFESFENYNRSITAVRDGSRYSIVHWNTPILEYDVDKSEIVMLRSYYISQTTSTLVGRILRSLPPEVVLEMSRKFSERREQYRILKMARLI
jgi:hypothetical protein